MTKHLVPVLIALTVAFGGCIFSPDDDVTPPNPPATGWQPELWVTPDSVSVFFPNDWPDTTTFVWNRYGRGVREYVMEAVVPIGSVNVHLAFMRESVGGPRQYGSFSQMAADAFGSYWVTDRSSGEVLYGPPLAINRVHVLDDGVLLRVWSPVAGELYGNPPPMPRFWTTTFTRRGLFEAKTVRKNAVYVHDFHQEEVRRVDGALYADDYVVMDLALKEFLRHRWPATVVAPRTLRLPKPPAYLQEFNFIDRDIDALRPDHDTRAAFDVMRLKELDTSALSQLGYTIEEEPDAPAPNTLYVQLSAIAYNHARTEALLYGTSYCGNLCGEGDLFLLQKIDGYWVMKISLVVWIS